MCLGPSDSVKDTPAKMKPIQIGLLVLVGALGGALIMMLTQRPKPAPAPVASTAPAAPADPVPPVNTAAPAVTQPAVSPSAAPAPSAPVRQRSEPVRRTPAPTAVADNQTPQQPEPTAPQPAPVPVEQPSAPPPAIDPAPAAAPAPEAAPAPAAEPASPPPPEQPPSVTLPAGMTVPVRLGESLSSEHNQAGDTFTGTLDAPLSAGGFVVAERGAHVEGRVIEAQKSGRGKKATLALELTKLNTSDGQHVEIKTEALRKQGTSMATTDQVGVVAAAAGIGAIIGAMAGGGKGAAIGAGAGGAAGGGGVVATRDKAVSLPTESKIAFRLSGPVTITEQMNR